LGRLRAQLQTTQEKRRRKDASGRRAEKRDKVWVVEKSWLAVVEVVVSSLLHTRFFFVLAFAACGVW